MEDVEANKRTYAKWQHLVVLMMSSLSARDGFIVRYHQNGYEIVASSSENQPETGCFISYDKNIFCKRIVGKCRRLTESNIELHKEWQKDPGVVEDGFDTYIGLPVLNPDRTEFGAIFILDHSAATNNKEHADLIKELKIIVEMDLQLLRKLEHASELSLTDDLTGLYNRRGFKVLAQHHFYIGKRSEKYIAIIVIDIDELKLINDRYGYAVGDEAIISVAKSIKRISRESDIVARIGGDEFLIAIPVLEENDVDVYLRRLREDLLITPLSNGVHVCISNGYHVKPFAGITSFDLSQFIQIADKRLYKMKEKKKSI
ncbi:GGDEF domain-containing protein [Bacterioplanoides sp.]|uniref:GGDEF domain-containing protein n=1 Tax=Bacterioplanoides sp. TaxID=2066072 RepID=UPI003AFFF56D